MDEILIDDKKYVSSKRAAQITGYAKDYIGQLCREGRVTARLVGRSWYVLESAIQDHRFGASEPVEPKTNVSVRPSFSSSWQSPRYEAASEEILPPVGRHSEPEKPVSAIGDVAQQLQDSWREWFSRVGEPEPAAAAEVATEEEQEEEVEVYAEAVPEEEGEDVSIPIRAIHHSLPARDHLPPLQMSSEALELVQDEEMEQEVHVRRIKRGSVRTIQFVSVFFALVAVTLAAAGSGYLDKYVVSIGVGSQAAGVSLYNK